MQIEKYYPASEITVLGVCFVMLVLLFVSFKVRMKSFRIFVTMLGMLIVATGADLALHYIMAGYPDAPRPLIYGLRSIYHVLLLCLLHHYCAYTCEVTNLSDKQRKPWIILTTAMLIFFSAADVVGIYSGRTMHIINGEISFEGSAIFSAGYIAFVAMLLPLSFYKLRFSDGKFERIFYGAAIFSYTGVLLCSMARSSWIGAVFGLFFLFFFMKKAKLPFFCQKKRFFKIFCTFLLLFILFFPSGSGNMRQICFPVLR